MSEFTQGDIDQTLQQSGHCVDCGGALYYIERVIYPQAYCRTCAARRGIRRLCDRNFYVMMVEQAMILPPRWRWTVYLAHSILWTVQR